MEDGSPIWGLAVFVILIILHGILHGFGAAVQNLNESDVEKKAEEGDRKSSRLLHIMDNPGQFINTLLITITLVNMVVGAYEYHIFAKVIGTWLNLEGKGAFQYYAFKALIVVAPALVLLMLLVIFGIIVPKKLGNRYSEEWAYKLLGMVSVISTCLKPLTATTAGISNLIVRMFGMNPHEEYDNVTEEEIMSMVNEGHEQGVLLESEARMITNIFEFGDKKAEDIMTHRKNIVAVDGSWSLKETIEFLVMQNNSRFPVFLKDIDNIIGILHFRDAMIYYEQHETDKPISEIPELLREAHFIPETRNINLLFKQMQSQKIHMEIVVDEYGQTVGLVAMEDILEEIVGNILDEYDEDEEMIIKQEDGVYLIKGMADLEEVFEVLELDAEEEYDTLNGFLVSKLDRIPQEGETMEIVYKQYHFSALKIENKTIQLVRVEKLEPPSEEAQLEEEERML